MNPQSTVISGDFSLIQREATFRPDDSCNIESLEEESSSGALGTF
jgi:hypothetical protein